MFRLVGFIFILFLLSCSSKQDRIHQEYCANFPTIKESGFIDHKGWRIYPREGSSKSIYYFEYYYPHEDARLYEYNSEGNIYLPSKYKVITFGIEDSSSIQGLTHSTDSIYSLLSAYLEIPKSLVSDSVESFAHKFFSLKIESFTAYPWAKGIASFKFKGGATILYLPAQLKSDSVSLNNYTLLETNWYCKE